MLFCGTKDEVDEACWRLFGPNKALGIYSESCGIGMGGCIKKFGFKYFWKLESYVEKERVISAEKILRALELS